MSLIKQPSELTPKSIVKMLVYGQPGAGKTQLALSAPKPLLLDFDGGVDRVNGAFRCPTVQVEKWQDVIDVMKEDLSEYETLVVDTAGKMLDFISADIISRDYKMGTRDGSLTLKGYGARKVMFVNFVKQAASLGKHLVFVAHEVEDKGSRDIHTKRPEIGGSSRGDLLKELDVVGYLQVLGRDRVITFQPQEEYYAKRTGCLAESYTVPCNIGDDQQPTGGNVFLTDLFSANEEFKKQEVSLRGEYDALLAKIAGKVGGIKDAETANAVCAEVKGFGTIWDSRLRAGRMVADRAAKVGLTFNRETKSYEAAV